MKAAMLILAQVGSPEWFDASEFFAGWGVAWATVGAWFVYWLIKRSADDALD